MRRTANIVKHRIYWLIAGIAIILAVAVVSSRFATQDYPQDLVYQGIPKRNSSDIGTINQVLLNQAYVAGYSDWLGNPLWVSYRLEPVVKKRSLRRPEDFQIDSRTVRRVSQDDYNHSGYQRGHLAPNFAISQLYGKQAQLETFLMSNITPQKAALNQKLWQRIEELEIDHYAREHGQIIVLTGPIFPSSPDRTRSGVAIPEAFYKVLLVPGNPPRAIAFIVPQTVTGYEPLTRFTATIDEIEARTGLDFFHQLPDDFEPSFESKKHNEKFWELHSVARRPPRY